MKTMSDDAELLERYARQGAEEAFARLVHRHLNLLWATARRITCDADLAHDVAQSVFTDLARKAGRLPRGTLLPGWLHRATSMAASKAVRGNARRTERQPQPEDRWANNPRDRELASWIEESKTPRYDLAEPCSLRGSCLFGGGAEQDTRGACAPPQPFFLQSR